MIDLQLIEVLKNLNKVCPEGFEYKSGGKVGCGKCIERRKQLKDLRTEFKNRNKK